LSLAASGAGTARKELNGHADLEGTNATGPSVGMPGLRGALHVQPAGTGMSGLRVEGWRCPWEMVAVDA